jgi:hypothetical protein
MRLLTALGQDVEIACARPHQSRWRARVGLWRALSHTAGTAFADLLLNGHRKKRRQRAALEAGVIPARARLEEDPHNRNACPQARLHNELRTQLLVRE